MDPSSIEKTVLHLWEVEKLSMRQIASQLKMGRDRVSRIIQQKTIAPKPEKSKFERFYGLVREWLVQFPRLLAVQVFERLVPYGYDGSYSTVNRIVNRIRPKKEKAYHALSFLPGEEAQVDWFFFKHPLLGALAGFLYVLSYSRYAWGVIYPRHSFEFFLAGHLCF